MAEGQEETPLAKPKTPELLAQAQTQQPESLSKMERVAENPLLTSKVLTVRPFRYHENPSDTNSKSFPHVPAAFQVLERSGDWMRLADANGYVIGWVEKSDDFMPWHTRLTVKPAVDIPVPVYKTEKDLDDGKSELVKLDAGEHRIYPVLAIKEMKDKT